MFMWREFDRSAIDEDLASIRDLGISSVKIFLMWEDFQPEPKKIPATMLDRLVDLLDMAEDRNLEVMATLFTGHMSGLNWLPPWMLFEYKSIGGQVVSLCDFGSAGVSGTLYRSWLNVKNLPLPIEFSQKNPLRSCRIHNQ